MMNLLLPTFAVATINQEWSFDIDFLGISYKPWRFFLMICAAPNLFCALLLIFIVPESPKFTYSQGDEAKTLRILSKVYRLNTGKYEENFKVSEIIKNEEFNESNQVKARGFFKFMWTQSVPLFKGKHLRNILTACFIQFAACNTINGFWTFMPEIMNKISLWNQNQNRPATICEIFTYDFNVNNQTQTGVGQCIQKLEIGTYLHAFESISLFAISYLIMTLVINRIGKLIILSVVLFPTGIAAFLLIFIKIPAVSSYLYLIMLLAALAISVVNASTVELFPTKMRAMAICLSMMVGRLGSASGSVIIGLLIDKNCDLTFLMPTVLLIVSGILAFTIPNISKRYL